MPYVTADDGAEIFYKDWGGGDGSPVILSHGWPLNADAWDAAARFLGEHGHRAIAHDRRGHGRSTRRGTQRDGHLRDDLACLAEHLDLRGVTLVGHSTGGGEIVRYLGRHGSERVAKLVLVSAVPPYMVLTDDNPPEGVPIDVFDGIRAGEASDRSQLYRDFADGPFFGNNRNNDVSQGVRDAFWLQSMACGHRAAYECIAAFSATDFREDLAKIDVPTLVIHGDDDQIVPFDVGGKRSAALIDGAQLIVYEHGAHGLPDTDRDRLHADLLAFIDS